jgi:hypothetical protein
MKPIADTLGVARSNLIEQVQRPPRPRPTYRKADDVWLLPLVRAIVDERPTYGYRRVGALLNRQVAALSKPPVNHKRGVPAHEAERPVAGSPHGHGATTRTRRRGPHAPLESPLVFGCV